MLFIIGSFQNAASGQMTVYLTILTKGSVGDSQKPVVNDNVLYHSLLELARARTFGSLYESLTIHSRQRMPPSADAFLPR
jgi:hypothetical protein